MSGKEIPLISVTSNFETHIDDLHANKDLLINSHTDIEDIDSGDDVQNVQIPKPTIDQEETDVEDVKYSDEEEYNIPETHLSLEHLTDFGDTTEEQKLLKNVKGKKLVSSLETSKSSKPKIEEHIFLDDKTILTDVDVYEASEDDTLITKDIPDIFVMELQASTSIKEIETNYSASDEQKNSKKHKPLISNINSINETLTDTEDIVYNDVKSLSLLNRITKTKKHSEISLSSSEDNIKYSDVEYNENDDDDDIEDVASVPGLPEIAHDRVQIFNKVVSSDSESNNNTDNELFKITEQEMSSSLPTRKTYFKEKSMLYKKNEHHESNDEINTDSDEFAVSDIDSNNQLEILKDQSIEETNLLSNIEGSTVFSKETPLLNFETRPEFKNEFTDEEDISDIHILKSKHAKKEKTDITSSSENTEEDDLNDSEYESISLRRQKFKNKNKYKETECDLNFIKKDGKSIPIVLTPNIQKHKKTTNLEISEIENDIITDVEEMESEKEFENTPKYSDFNLEDVIDFSTGIENITSENSKVLRPITSKIVSSDIPSSLAVYDEMPDSYTDLEDMAASGDELLTVDDPKLRSITPDLPILEGGYIDASESIKTDKKKLKIPQVKVDPKTDTEDVILDCSFPLRKKRNKHKSRKQYGNLKLDVTGNAIDVTDVEEIVFSDSTQSRIIPCRIQNDRIQTQILDFKTDIEYITETGSDEDVTERKMSATPDVLHKLGEYQLIAMKEGDGPFNEKTRNEISADFQNKLPLLLSPSPDVVGKHTDDEEVVASDEDETPSNAFSSVELEINDTIIHVNSSPFLDYEAPEEAKYLKYSDTMRESHTDIEDFPFETDSKPSSAIEEVADDLTVVDNTDKFCVCIDADKHQRQVCVCVGKLKGDISLEATYKNDSESTSKDIKERSIGYEADSEQQAGGLDEAGALVRSEFELGEPTIQQRVVTTHTRTVTTIGPDGERTTVVETESSGGEPEAQLAMQQALDQFMDKEKQ